ncbi:MAG: PepSY-associated TM helix domain-containing protein, partial [Bacteroidota bacterium]
MLNKIWRTSHLLIALVSVVFLLLASVSGIILALEPIQEELQPLSIKGAKSITVGELLENLDGQYEEILEIEVLTNDAVKISTFDMDEEKNGDFIINPHTGDKIGDIPPKNQFFQSITNFHRSLFLKSTGRFIIGVTAFLFFLSIVTGFLLLLKREGSLLAIYRKTIKTRWDQYWHVVISKWTVLPLLIIALTGVYLSLLRFEIIPEPPMQA